MLTPATSGAVTALDRTTVRSYTRYADAQRAVDHLSDSGFPVGKVSIVGSDLKMVENVVGRLTRGRAALAGAASGAWLGVLIGLLLGLFAPDGTSVVALVLDALLFGVLFGASWGFVAHAVTRGRRDFSSLSAIVAGTYDVQTDPDVADDARHRLMSLEWQQLGT